LGSKRIVLNAHVLATPYSSTISNFFNMYPHNICLAFIPAHVSLVSPMR
jgi:hypothetical protein